MPNFTGEIKTYKVSYFAGTAFMYRAWITLYDGNDSMIGWAFFHKDPSTIPPDGSMNGSCVICRYSWEDFPNIIDLLRNEKPVYVNFTQSSLLSIISTSAEPVGEGEN